MPMKQLHLPVLLAEVIHYLTPRDGGVYVDGNLGLGGHTEAILMASNPGGRVVGFDWDEQALELARIHLAKYSGRVEFVRRNFAEVKDVLNELGIARVDGLLLDLGLSSLQLGVSCGRGFSFQGSEPLDMRMDVRGGETAADLLNHASEEELADIFYYYGDERQARRIAAHVAGFRKEQPLLTTDQLVKVVEEAVPPRFRPKKIHVATKVFQALRIAVNHELDNLEKILACASEIVKPQGRICIISFHSLEDRLVKRAFRDNSALKMVTSRAVVANEDEVKRNPRSRSARLRVASVREQ
ncbi:MAG: 16S rRNA (cytosine(1402)-N(4))-methyltransferase RsmH [Deltaproteobacteria bacterium]|nr:16S rRNA (cytosine(1402)-N(4))-methyltransferase RsmH [Deltaproteobacteria bacterium]